MKSFKIPGVKTFELINKIDKNDEGLAINMKKLRFQLYYPAVHISSSEIRFNLPSSLRIAWADKYSKAYGVFGISIAGFGFGFEYYDKECIQ